MANKHAKKSTVNGDFEYVGKHHGIREYRLKKNDLRVLYYHDASSPVVGFMVTYFVGSRYEVTGNTGSTHILEHMMFKGSKKFNFKKESALSVFEKMGGLVNATTWLDRTNYYEVLPKEHFKFAVRLEADRMRNAFIAQKDLDKELPAVISEYTMHENVPVEYLDEKIWATAFMAHPYHHSTLGWLSDIKNTTAEKLKNFYDTYYHPNNAVVTVIGDIEEKEALSTIAKYFGVHEKSKNEIPIPCTKEPEQKGRRFVEVKRAGSKNVVAIAFKVPEALNADTPKIMALNAILAEGKTSRLYKALVDKQFATSVSSAYMPFYDPSLLVFYIVPNGGVVHEKIEGIVLKECKKIREKDILEKELKIALSGVCTEMAFARDGHYATLSYINEALSAGDWRFFFDLPKKIEKIKIADIKKVAKKYLGEDKMTVGYYRALEK